MILRINLKKFIADQTFIVLFDTPMKQQTNYEVGAEWKSYKLFLLYQRKTKNLVGSSL